MVETTHKEIRMLNDVLGMKEGYVLNFTNAEFAEFIECAVGKDIYSNYYGSDGNSKARRLKCFIKKEDTLSVAKLLRELVDYGTVGNPTQKNELLDFICKLEGGKHVNTQPIKQFKSCDTLAELIAAIDRDIKSGSYSASTDRLHTFCTKRFRFLLENNNITYTDKDPLHSLAGKYKKHIQSTTSLSTYTLNAIQQSISCMTELNDIRNNKSLAHDNELINQDEARYIFNSITNVLQFIDGLENKVKDCHPEHQ